MPCIPAIILLADRLYAVDRDHTCDAAVGKIGCDRHDAGVVVANVRLGCLSSGVGNDDSCLQTYTS